MAAWTKDTALQELLRLVTEITTLGEGRPYSGQHTYWLLATSRFLEEVFGRASTYYRTFVNIQWVYRGSAPVHYSEAFRPDLVQERYDMPVYFKALDTVSGVLIAAGEDLDRRGLEAVYEGKDTGPEASLILKIINLAESKLRKTLRTPPMREREVQDAFENLLLGAGIEYSREKETIEYSSKKYIPDFTVPKADLAVELKLSTDPKHEKEFIAQINDDLIAYRTKYGNIFFVVYDCGFIRDVDLFAASFESHGAVYVRVIKH